MSVQNVRETLANQKSSLTEVLRAVGEIKNLPPFERTARFGVSGNITCDSLGTFLKRHAFLNGQNAEVVQGNFDTHAENMATFAAAGVEYVVLFHFFDAILPSLQARVPHLTPEFRAEVRASVRGQLDLVLAKGASFHTIFVPTFHSFLRVSALHRDDPAAAFLAELNAELSELATKYRNVKLLSSDALLAELGRDQALDDRYYFKFRAPYRGAFMDRLARDAFLHLRGGKSYFYKALVLDCDNTLWGGVIGEDLLHGIKLDPHEYPGNIFWMVQNQILELQSRGVLLVLCSKNNLADVDQVFANHPHSVLKDAHVVLKKVNWTDKSQNLREIAKELNIGLDSLVFLDDSDFEVNAVRGQLPMVRTIQVPKNVFEYPATFQEVRELFLPWEQTAESGAKTEQYRMRAQAIAEQAAFANQDDYLRSLQLRVRLKKNDEKSVPRISELTQKSNQFNVNTRRYSPSEIEAVMRSDDGAVYSLNVSDKMGDSGLTGIAIVRYDGTVLRVETFLMSCRVIGRGVEFAFWKNVFDDARARGCTSVRAEFLKSAKNELVVEFFDQLGLPVVESLPSGKIYSAPLDAVSLPPSSHVEVSYES